MTKGTLYLVPVPIAETEFPFAPSVLSVLSSLRFYVVENAKTARYWLKKASVPMDTIQVEVLNKNTPTEEVPTLLKPLLEGHSVGVLSEAGCPGVADPGSAAVSYAHANDIRVVPLIGASSILLALMASGMNGQQFAFHGYLPQDEQACKQKIMLLEKESRQKKQTQIVMDTPYRNQALLSRLLKFLQPNTRLCVAQDITGSHEKIITKTIAQWKSRNETIEKIPCLFLIEAS